MKFGKLIPKKVVIEPTTRCNASCVYCGNKAVPKMDMPLDLYKAIIDASPFAKRIDPVSRGEPLMYPHIVEAVEYAAQKGKQVVMHTNGSMMNGEMALALMRAGLHMIVFSVDEMEKEPYEKIRQGLDFDEITKNIEIFQYLRNFHRFKTETRVRICHMKENSDRIKEIFLHWMLHVDSVTTGRELHIMSKEEICLQPYRFNDNPLKCGEVETSLAIRPDGTVVLCCSDWYDNYAIGKIGLDVTERQLIDIFNNELANAIRHGMRTGEFVPQICATCKGRSGTR